MRREINETSRSQWLLENVKKKLIFCWKKIQEIASEQIVLRVKVLFKPPEAELQFTNYGTGQKKNKHLKFLSFGSF